MNSLEITDAESKAVQKTPNRVSLEYLESQIRAKYVSTAYDLLGEGVPRVDELKILTICILVMQNGFTIIGKSAPADADNFDAELGAKFAYEDAVRQLWPFEGYALRSALSKVGNTPN